jgi:hypothetical protein
MEGYFSTGQSPQWAVVPVEEEEEECSLIIAFNTAVNSNGSTHNK